MHTAPAEDRQTTRSLLLKTLAVFVLLFAGVWLLARFFREDLEGLGRRFVDTFGVGGMFLGSLLADAIHFPIPPQFYMLTAITTGTSIVAAMTAICLGSLLGGNFSFACGRYLGHTRLLKRVMERTRPTMDPLFQRYGVWTIAIASLTPLPFSTFCLVCGMYRISWRLFALLVTLRVPRLMVFYLLIKAGWAAG